LMHIGVIRNIFSAGQRQAAFARLRTVDAT
jgi:hypothetical protein